MLDRRPAILFLLLFLGTLACKGEPDRSIEIEADRRVESSPILLEKLAAGNDDERRRAARAMGRIQSPSYLDALIGALDDELLTVRYASLFAIGQFGLVQHQGVDPRAAESLLPYLSNEDVDTVAEALYALGKVGDIRAADSIHPLLSHDSPRVRAEAAMALFRLRFAPVWRRSAEQPPSLPDEAVDALKQAMKDANPGVRLAATYAFSRYPDERARGALAEALEDAEAQVRMFATRGLGLVARDDEVPALIHRLFDEHHSVRYEAVGALRRAQAFGPLEPQIEDPSPHVRAAVAAAFSEASSASSLDVLRFLTGDPSVTVRVAAIDALSARLEAAGLEEFADSADDTDWRIRAAVARAAGRAGESGLEMAGLLFLDEDVRVKTAVLVGLRESGTGDSIVDTALTAQDLALRGTAVEIVAQREHLDRTALLAQAYDLSSGEAWVEVREAVADALVSIEGAEELLRRIATADEAPSVRAKAAAGLDDPPPATPGEPVPASPRLDGRTPRAVEVDLETRHGTMRIQLFGSEAPVHVSAFLERVDAGFYDGLTWHRVVPNFVIQGGDPRGDGWGSDDETLRDEINAVRYGRGAVGMPKAGKDTGGCQLFITHVPTPHLDGNYTIFGRVVSGLDVIDRVEVGDEIVSIRRAP